jgi:hypothetical protein
MADLNLIPNPLVDAKVKDIELEDLERAKKELDLANKERPPAPVSPTDSPSKKQARQFVPYHKPQKMSLPDLFSSYTQKNENTENKENKENKQDKAGIFSESLATKIKNNIIDIKTLIQYQYEQIGRLSTDPKKKKRIDRMKKLIEETETNSKQVLTPEEQIEIEQYLSDFREEQLEILKENVAVSSDYMIDNDLIMLDSGDQKFNKYVKMNTDEKLSNSLDILAIFLKSEKILYTEAKTYCEQQLNFLMLPAIFISALTTVLSMALTNYMYGDLIIASLTAINSFLLAIISYLKLDAKSEAHKTSAYQFDKLQTKCEFGSGRVIFFNKFKLSKSDNDNGYDIDEESTEHPYDKIFALVDEIEAKVSEIKDMNKFILPEKIRKKYPNLYGINIFSAVKSYLIVESSLKSQLTQVTAILGSMRDQINEINDLPIDSSRKPHSNLIYSWNMNVKNKRRLEEELIATRENYMKLDRSIANDLNTKNGESDYCDCCIWMKT